MVSPSVTNQLQKPTAMQAPVIEPAMKPATDLRGAKGSWRIGRRLGSFGVYAPKARPKVEAAVSAHERLTKICVSEFQGEKIVRKEKGRTLEWIQQRCL